MTKASKRGHLLFMILLSGCFKTVCPLLHPANPMFATEREQVLHFSAHDPCSRGGLWFVMDDAAKTRANNDCKTAFDYFNLLTDQEQESCPESEDPRCLSGFGCTSFEFKCTFQCRTVDEVWRRQDDRAGRLVREPVTVWKAKDLRTIAATVVEPRIIPPGRALCLPQSKKTHPCTIL